MRYYLVLKADAGSVPCSTSKRSHEGAVMLNRQAKWRVVKTNSRSYTSKIGKRKWSHP